MASNLQAFIEHLCVTSSAPGAEDMSLSPPWGHCLEGERAQVLAMKSHVVHAVLEGLETCTESSLGDTARLPGGGDP